MANTLGPAQPRELPKLAQGAPRLKNPAAQAEPARAGQVGASTAQTHTPPLTPKPPVGRAQVSGKRRDAAVGPEHTSTAPSSTFEHAHEAEPARAPKAQHLALGLTAPAGGVTLQATAPRDVFLPGLPRPYRTRGQARQYGRLAAIFLNVLAPSLSQAREEARSRSVSPRVFMAWRTPSVTVAHAVPKPSATAAWRTAVSVRAKEPVPEPRAIAVAVVGRKNNLPRNNELSVETVQVTPLEATGMAAPAGLPHAMMSLAAPKSPTALVAGLAVPRKPTAQNNSKKNASRSKMRTFAWASKRAAEAIENGDALPDDEAPALHSDRTR